MPILEPADQHQAIRALINETVRNHGWRDAANHAMRHLADTGRPFSADDLRDLMGDHQPDNPNSIGGIFMAWNKAKLITRHGGGPSRTNTRHGGHRNTWIGNHNTQQQKAA